MAHGVNSVLKRGPSALGCKNECNKTGIGSRRIFAPHFKLQVLDSYRNDADCKGNQRATARKYGIHRRQIQKWLQVENNLRNSVSKAKSGEPTVIPEARKCGIELALRSVAHRQRDDLCADAYSQSNGGTDARVPAISPVAVPYNVNSGGGGTETAPCWAADLSNDGDDGIRRASVPTPLDFTTHSRGSQNANGSRSVASASPAVADPAAPIDLSLKKHVSTPPGEIDAPVPYCQPSTTPPRPSSNTDFSSTIKTDPDVWDLSTRGQHKRKYEDTATVSIKDPQSSSHGQPKPVKLFKPYLDDLNDGCQQKFETPSCCNSSLIFYPTCDSYCYNNNNNNDYQYTLHELQPKNSINYFCSVTQTYMYQGQECCSVYSEENVYPNMPPLKQRQSYSLDFKLSAIECYHQDSLCRGNQRAVANKYNIHRRQVQKWLQQEDELRQRNETIKQMHAVR